MNELPPNFSPLINRNALDITPSELLKSPKISETNIVIPKIVIHDL